MLIAAIIGIFTAIVSFIFNQILVVAISFLNQLNFYLTDYFFLPIIGGLILAYLNYYVLKGDSDFEFISFRKEGYVFKRDLFNITRVIMKIFSSIVSLIFGFSVGKQGTIVYIGEVIGFYTGYDENRTDVELKTYMLCAIAGMISGVFGVTIFAIVFTYEVFSNKFRMKRLFLMSITAFVTKILMVFIKQDKPFLDLFYNINVETINILHFIIFTIIISLVSFIYVYVIKNTIRRILFYNMRLLYFPMLVGLVLFIAGIKFPEIFILHFDGFKMLLNNEYSVLYLVLLLIIKIFVTDISYNFGGYGGLFLPGLHVGAITGVLFVSIIGEYLMLKSYVLLGIVGMLAGFASAPIASVILAYSISNEIMIIPYAIIIALVGSYLLKFSLKENIYKKTKNFLDSK